MNPFSSLRVLSDSFMHTLSICQLTYSQTSFIPKAGVYNFPPILTQTQVRTNELLYFCRIARETQKAKHPIMLHYIFFSPQ